jgi:type VI protein secretion system component VasK
VGEWLQRWQTWLTIASVLAAALMVTNIAIFEGNRTVQAEVSRRAQYLQQTVQVENVGREIVRAAVDAALHNGDEALKSLLTQNGVTFPPSPASAPPAPATGSGGARQ